MNAAGAPISSVTRAFLNSSPASASASASASGSGGAAREFRGTATPRPENAPRIRVKFREDLSESAYNRLSIAMRKQLDSGMPIVDAVRPDGYALQMGENRIMSPEEVAAEVARFEKERRVQQELLRLKQERLGSAVHDGWWQRTKDWCSEVFISGMASQASSPEQLLLFEQDLAREREKRKHRRGCSF